MEKRLTGKTNDALTLYVSICWVLTALLAVVVIPLTMWFVWLRHRTALIESVTETVLSTSFVLGLVALWGLARSSRNLGQASLARLVLGSRPSEAGELQAWRWGRCFLYSWLVCLACLIGIGFILWLRGE